MGRRSVLVRAFRLAAVCLLCLVLVMGLRAYTHNEGRIQDGLTETLGQLGKSDEERIQESLTETLELFRQPDEEHLGPYLDMTGVDFSQVENSGVDLFAFLGSCFRLFDYRVDDISVKGDEATATITLTNGDVEDASRAVSDEIASNMGSYVDLILADDGEREFAKLFFEKVEEQLDGDDETVTRQVTLRLEREDGRWRVANSSVEELVVSLFGDKAL